MTMNGKKYATEMEKLIKEKVSTKYVNKVRKQKKSCNHFYLISIKEKLPIASNNNFPNDVQKS